MNQNSVIYPFLEKEREGILRSIVSAESNILVDNNGNRYIDGLGGLMNVIVGYDNKNIIDAIQKQLNQLPYVNLWANSSPIIERLAEKLTLKTEGICDKVMYAVTGSESVDLSIKIAREYQYRSGNKKKKYVVGLDLSYHGTTYGAISITGIDQGALEGVAPTLPGIGLLQTPGSVDNQSYIEYINKFFEKNHEKIAAVLLEPIICSGGVFRLDQEIMEAFYLNCRKYSMLLVLDEVTTAFYRTGDFFAYQTYENIEPDIICLSKAITNGFLPLSCVLINKRVSSFLTKNKPIPHFSTQNGNPVCCAAAVAVLEELESGNYKESNLEKSQYLKEALNKYILPIDNINSIRVEGMMMAMEIISVSNELLSFNEVWEIAEKLKDNGLIVYPFSNYKSAGITITPSYNISHSEIDEMVSILTETLKRQGV